MLTYGLGGLAGALLLWFFATCGGGDPIAVCPVPAAGSEQGLLLQRVRADAGFPVLYPCQMPLGQTLTASSVTGVPGRRQAELVFSGAFDLTIRQAQFPPIIPPDPAGASRRTIDLFPNVRAILIEINDGSGQAQYHYFWERNGIYFEVQSVGPPLQERSMRRVATSLESLD